MRNILFLILSFCLIAPFTEAQHRRASRSFGRKKGAYRYEVIAGFGATNFLGDLGGANQIGTHGFKDFEYVLTRPAIEAGIRFKLGPYFSVKNNLCWGIVRGDDKLTT